MKSLTVGKRVALICTLLVLLSLITSTVAILCGSRLSGSVHHTAATVPAIQKLASVQALGLEYRGTSLLMGTPGLVDSYRQKQIAHLDELNQQIMETLNSYEGSIPAEEQALFATTRQEVSSFLAICQEFRKLALADRGAEAGAFWSKEGATRSKAFRKALQDELDFNNGKASQAVTSGIAAANSNRFWCLTLAAVSVLSGCILGWFLVTNLNRTLSDSTAMIRAISGQLVQASTQVATASQQLADASGAQAASLEETSASGHQIKMLTARNTEGTHHANTLMGKVSDAMRESSHQLEQLIQSMREITDSSCKVTEITKLIEAIAFQTNILALNAAVEAARAGEAGMGFAVVANEVRSLAVRCSDAARDTAGLIEKSLSDTNRGSKRLDELSVSMDAIAKSASEVTRIISEVNVGASEQLRGIDQIASTLIQMQQLTQSTAASAEESASASKQLEAQSESMQGVVEQLQALL